MVAVSCFSIAELDPAFPEQDVLVPETLDQEPLLPHWGTLRLAIAGSAGEPGCRRAAAATSGIFGFLSPEFEIGGYNGCTAQTCGTTATTRDQCLRLGPVSRCSTSNYLCH
jgi:hypothetical protein